MFLHVFLQRLLLWSKAFAANPFRHFTFNAVFHFFERKADFRGRLRALIWTNLFHFYCHFPFLFFFFLTEVAIVCAKRELWEKIENRSLKRKKSEKNVWRLSGSVVINGGRKPYFIREFLSLQLLHPKPQLQFHGQHQPFQHLLSDDASKTFINSF